MSDIKKKVADFSRWNQITNFQALADDLDGVMLRIGGIEKDNKPYMDATSVERYRIFNAFNVPIGIYYVVQNNIAESDINMYFEHFQSLVIPYRNLLLPVAIDIEFDYRDRYNIQTSKKVAALASMIQNSGYYVTIYSSANAFRNLLDLNILEPYDKWVAAWNDGALNNKPEINTHYGMWQYTNCYRHSAVNGNFDMSYMYYDYPEAIIRARLNHSDSDNSECSRCDKYKTDYCCYKIGLIDGLTK